MSSAGERAEVAPQRTTPSLAGVRASRRLGWLLLAVVLLAGVAYVTFVGVEASRQAVSVDENKNRDCRTPFDRYGWRYEAINYPMGDDNKLRAVNPDMSKCASQGMQAGEEVVTADGIRIAGWYIPAADGTPASGPTVVMVHGYGGNKSSDLAYAVGLHQHLNLVAFDQRNGGRSTGSQTTLGVLEQNDVRAVIDWLERTKHPTELGLWGDSMGAAAAIGEARHDPRVEALALDEVHTRLVYQFEQRLKEKGHPPYPGTWATFVGTWIRTGVWFGAGDPADALGDMGNRPIMLVHGTSDSQDLPERTQEFYDLAKAMGLTIELHWCAGATHGHLNDKCPMDLASWTGEFFNRSLRREDAGG
jgi:pimeloyl-ACP methyl ester carboxylesterase